MFSLPYFFFFTSIDRFVIWFSGIVIVINLAVARLSCGAEGIFRSSNISLISFGRDFRLALVLISCIKFGALPFLSNVVVIWRFLELLISTLIVLLSLAFVLYALTGD